MGIAQGFLYACSFCYSIFFGVCGSLGIAGVLTGLAWGLYNIFTNLRAHIGFALAFFGRSYRRRDKKSKHNHIPLQRLDIHKPLSPAERFFNLQEATASLSLVFNYLHFSDVIALAFTSRLLYKTIFSNDSFSIERLRLTTCTKGSKNECWACGNQICAVCQVPIVLPFAHTNRNQECSTSRPLRSPSTTFHLEECMPICSPCCLRHIRKPRRRFREQQSPQCSHHEPEMIRDRVARELCSSCSVLFLDDAATEKRERKERSELEAVDSTRVFCFLCGMFLHRVLPRWWICSICGVMCRSGLHSF